MEKEKLNIRDCKDNSILYSVNKSDTVRINQKNEREFYLVFKNKNDLINACFHLGWDLNGKYNERNPLPVRMNDLCKNEENYLFVELDTDIFTIEG